MSYCQPIDDRKSVTYYSCIGSRRVTYCTPSTFTTEYSLKRQTFPSTTGYQKFGRFWYKGRMPTSVVTIRNSKALGETGEAHRSVSNTLGDPLDPLPGTSCVASDAAQIRWPSRQCNDSSALDSDTSSTMGTTKAGEPRRRMK